MESGGFQLVTRKTCRKSFRPRLSKEGCKKIVSKEDNVVTETVTKLHSSVLAKKNMMRQDGFFQQFESTFKQDYSSTYMACSKIIMLGLGSISQGNENARYQLAFLLLLVEFLATKNGGLKGTTPLVEVFDPAFTSTDRNLLKMFNFRIAKDNRCGKDCSIALEGSTLLYMPHCPMRLYSNVLWSLWNAEALSKTLIIGNSFSAYDERMLEEKHRRDDTNCVLKLIDFVQETTLEYKKGKDCERAFNDTCLISFKVKEAEEFRIFDVRPAEYFGPITC